MDAKRVLISLPFVLLIYLSPGQEIHDLRVVNGITVDLGPLQAWLAKSPDEREGERPLKHWKELQILEAEPMAGWFKCKVQMEGLTRTNLIANLPPQARKVLQEINDTYVKLQKLRVQIAASEIAVRRADAVTPTGALGDRAYVDSVMNQRYQVNLAGAQLEEAKKILSQLEAKHREYMNSHLSETKVFAMFAGRKYGGLEIWDCGAKKE